MNMIIFLLFIVSKFTGFIAADQQEEENQYWEQVSEKFDDFVVTLTGILDRSAIINARKQILPTSTLATQTINKINIDGSTTDKNGNDYWDNVEMDLPDCKQTVNEIVNKIRMDINNRWFNRDEFHFGKDIPAMEAQCQNLSPELKKFFKRDKNPLLKEIYDLLAKIDNLKVDWNKAMQNAEKLVNNFKTEWDTQMAVVVNESLTEELQDVYSGCMKSWEDSKIIENIKEKILTSSVFRHYFGKFQTNCHYYLKEMSGRNGFKLDSALEKLEKIFEKILSTYVIRTSRFLPHDEYTPFTLVADKVDWTKIKNKISAFVQKRNDIFELAEHKTNDQDLKDAYQTCRKSLSIEDLDPDSLFVRIRGHYLSKLYFVENWWEFELKLANTCNSYFGVEDGSKKRFMKEYESINATLTGLFDEFKGSDYNFIYNQLPKKAFVDENDNVVDNVMVKTLTK